MAIPIIPLAAGIALIFITVYKLIVFPAFISPLARIPNIHWTAPLSPLWILFHRQQQNDTTTIHAAHARHGPVIRLAPNEISINSVDGGIRTVYAGGFEKGDWYSNVFSNYGVEPMFAMEGHTEHSKRKRMLSNVYAKSTLQGSQALHKQTHILLRERLHQRLKAGVDAPNGIELYDVFAAVTMDFVSGYIFGLKNNSDHIRRKEEGLKLFTDFKSRQKYTFWPQEMAGFTNFMKRIGLKWMLVPTWVDKANQEIEDWVMTMCDKAESTLKASEGGEQVAVEDYPTVYAQLRNTLLKDAMKSDKADADESIQQQVQNLRLKIASEVLDHTLAGFDTSSITLTWLAWQLSRPQQLHWQIKLQEEIKTLNGSLDAKAIDNLPILHAIMMETLRLHAAIPGNQPRMTPNVPTTLGDTESGIAFASLPPGIRVQAQAWSLHRNSKVFPNPDEWSPDRWLDSDNSTQREMSRWFWAFGSGGRMCVGSNLAMLDMKATMVGLWGSFSTEILEDDGMVPNNGYMAEPLGVGPGGKKGIGKDRRFLRCRLTAVEKAG